jgi:hypothetical protein
LVRKEELHLNEYTNCGEVTDLIEGNNIQLCPLCIIGFYEELHKSMGIDLSDKEE